MERSDWAWAARRGWRRSRRHEAHTPMVLVRSGKCFLHLIVCVLFKIRHRFCLYCETDDVVVSSERELSDGEFSAKEKKSYGEFKGEALSCSCKNK